MEQKWTISIALAVQFLVLFLISITLLPMTTAQYHPPNEIAGGNFSVNNFEFPLNVFINQSLIVRSGNIDIQTGSLSAGTIDTGYGAKEIGDSVGNCASTDVHKGDGGCEAESSLSVNYATTSGTASDVSCTDCLTSTEVASADYATTSGTASDVSCTNCLTSTEVASADYATTAGDLSGCSNCIGAAEIADGLGVNEISDIFVRNTGDTITGNLYIDTTYDTLLYIRAETNYNSVIDLQEGGSRRWAIWNSGSDSDKFTITDIDATHGVYLNQNSNSWSQYSDIRLKSNITSVENVLDKIIDISLVRYIFKNSTEHEIGLIAQDVNQEFPEIVDDSGEYMGLQYSRIGPIALQAVKELKLEKDDEIEELKTQIDKINLENELLKIQNEALRSALCEEFPEKGICS